MIKFGIRSYDPEVGRWMQKEPLGLAGSLNFYAYCEGDAVNFVDLTGLLRLYYSVKYGELYLTDMIGSQPFSIKATSGRPKSGCMNNSKCEDIENVGPIPRGEYFIDVNELSDPNVFTDALRNFVYGDWGSWRVRIHNISFANKSITRNMFFYILGKNQDLQVALILVGDF